MGDDYMEICQRKIIDDEDVEDGVQFEIYNNKKYETEEAYYNRMKGFVGLFAGYLDIDLPSHPQPQLYKKLIQRLCRMFQYPILPPSFAPFLTIFLEIAGFSIHKRDPNTFRPLIVLISQNLDKKFINNSPISKFYNNRLRIYIDNLNNNQFTEPEGRKIHDRTKL